MIAALVLFAAIVSDNAKEFFVGGEWLPDAVPASAIYQGNPYEEEQRLTTNVCAGIASMYSGLFERWVVGNGIHLTNPDGSQGSCDYTYDDFKTNRFVVEKEVYESWGNWKIYLRLDTTVTRRLLDTYRVIGYNCLTNLRAAVQDVANGALYYDGGYYDAWGIRQWGSSWLCGDEFPTWGWSTNALTSETFSNVWPQYTSCPADGVWRTEAFTRRGALKDALGFFSIFDDDDPWGVEELCSVIGTNATPRSLFPTDLSAAYMDDMYSIKFGSATPRFMAGFTNNTHRLDYWRLAALETAVASMDTTYSTDEQTGNDWDTERRGYLHMMGKRCQVSPAAVVVDLDKMTASLSCDFDLEDFETWTTATNESRQTENPEFVCRGDTASGAIRINGSCAVFVTFDAVSNALEAVRTDDRCYAYFSTSISPGGIEAHMESKSTICAISNGEWTVAAVDSVSRGISVEYTTDLTNTCAESVQYPVPWAWSHRMVKDGLNALEWRCSNTNFNIETDTGGYIWYSFDEPEAAQHRSVYVGEYATTNAFLAGWRNARTAHRDAVGAYSIANVGCSLENHEALIPIGDAAVNHVVDAMPKQLTVDYAYNPINIAICAFWESDARDRILFYNETTYEYNSIDPGGAYQLGYLSFTYDLSVPVKSYFTLHPDRYTTGDIAPAQRIRWKFQNLHEY